MASDVEEKRGTPAPTSVLNQQQTRSSSGSEYHDTFDRNIVAGEGRVGVENDLNVTEDDLLEAKELAASFSLNQVKDVSTPIATSLSRNLPAN